MRGATGAGATGAGAGAGAGSGFFLHSETAKSMSATAAIERREANMVVLRSGGHWIGQFPGDYRAVSRRGDQAPNRALPARVSWRVRPDSVSSTQSCFVPERVEVNSKWRPSGAHEGASLRPSLVRACTLLSRKLIAMIWNTPPICDWNATRRPSGDQSGSERYN